jgi:hypothetical protein
MARTGAGSVVRPGTAAVPPSPPAAGPNRPQPGGVDQDAADQRAGDGRDAEDGTEHAGVAAEFATPVVEEGARGDVNSGTDLLDGHPFEAAVTANFDRVQ